MSNDTDRLRYYKQNPATHKGFFTAWRTETAEELLRSNGNAFLLLYVIAARARYSDAPNEHGLKVGEALIGDFENYDMSEQEYRTAKRHLEKWKLATFKPTTHGTIASLTSLSVFGVSAPVPNGRPTDENGRVGHSKVQNVENPTADLTDKLTDKGSQLKGLKSRAPLKTDASPNGQSNGQGNGRPTDAQRTEAKNLTTNKKVPERKIEGEEGSAARKSRVTRGLSL